MKIMPIRIGFLESTYAIYQKIGIPLLKYGNSTTHYIPLETSFGGDAGSFYCIPLLSSVFGLSLSAGIWWFYCILISIGMLVAFIAFLSIARMVFGALIGLFGVLAVGYISWCVGDEYSASFTAVALFPMIFPIIDVGKMRYIGLYCFIVGALGWYLHVIRAFSALPLWCGVVVALIVYAKNKRSAVIGCGALLMGVMASRSHVVSIVKERDMYLKQADMHYEKFLLQHTFWHNVYAGFGFITNDKGIFYGDSCSAEKVQSINPLVGYLTPEYEAILRAEVIKLIFYSPNFVLRVLWAKLGVLFYYLLLSVNIGLIAAWYYRKPWQIDVTYLMALIGGALPGIATIPIALYILGFITVAALYGIHSLIWACNKGLLQDLKKYFLRFF